MYGVLNVGSNNEIFWLFLLQYYLLYFYVVFGMVLVMQGIYIVEVQVRFQFLGDIGDCVGDFVGNEGFTVVWGFMVEENIVIGVYVVGFVVVNGDLVGVQFGDCIWRLWVEWCSFFLWNFLYQIVQFRGGSLIKMGFFFQIEEVDCFEQVQCIYCINVCGIFW